WNSVHLADDLDAMAGQSDEAIEQRFERFGGTFEAGRDEPGRDDGGFEQAEVILREVEDFGDGADVGAAAQVDAGEAEHGFIDDAEVGFDRGTRGCRAGSTDAEIDRDIQNARALRKIHTEEEDIAPAAMAEIHADGGSFGQDRK